MKGTTYVQIIKAVLLCAGAAVMAAWVLGIVGLDLGELLERAAARSPHGRAILEPGLQYTNPIDFVSLALALVLGTAGLPHILMRFYTVPDARAARTSVLYAAGLIGYFYLIIPVVGFGAAALVGREAIRTVDPGGNMAAPLLAELLGGTPFLGFIAAVAFATILAVVAGLTLAGASALSHDIFVHVVRGGHATEREQMRVARFATVGFGVLAMLLGILFRGQNVAFMVGLAFAVACSANFPALLLSITWRRFSTAGAVAAIGTGAGLSVLLIVLSPTVWVDVLGHAHPLFALRNPALVSMPAAFLAGIVVSLATPEPAAARKFDAEKLRTYLGVGSE
jgi:cation/acetate symporter